MSNITPITDAQVAPRHDQQNSKHHRRYSAEAWNCLRGQIDREHRALAAFDPYSPRIQPTLALLGLAVTEEGKR
jgi:hypothetical protein